MRASSIFVLALTAAVAAAHELLPVSRRAVLLRARDQTLAAVVPRAEVVVNYGEDPDRGASEVLYHAGLTLKAHADTPILALEELDSLLSTVSCSNSSVTLVFHDSATAKKVAGEWARNEKWVLVTAHESCGGENDRTPYLVTEVAAPAPKTLVLKAIHVPWKQATKGISVKLDHSAADQYHRELVRRSQVLKKRDIRNNTDIVTLKSNIPERVKLYPLPLLSRQNRQVTGGVATEVQVYCVGCATSGSILVRAEFDLGSDFFTDSSNPLGGDAVQIDAALIEIEVLTPLTARANLELFMGPGTVLSFKPQSVLPIPISTTPFAIPGLLTIGPIFDFGVAVDLTGPKGQANFTYGAEMVVPKGAKARIQFGADGNNSVATGWEGVDVDEIPFFLNQLEGELSFGLNITARPSITFGILAGGGKLAKLDAGFELDLPKVYAKATKRSKVNGTCDSPVASDFHFYPSGIFVETGVSFGISAVAEVGAGGTSSNRWPLLNQAISRELYSKDFPVADWCFALDEELGKFKNVTDTKLETDVEKVQKYIDTNGAIPSGVDKALFPNFKDKAGANSTDELDKAKGVVKGGGAELRAKSLGGLAMAFGVAFWML